MTHPVTIPLMGAVALASLALAAMAFRSYRRSGNANLRFVVAAFAIFAVKGVFATLVLWQHLLEHEDAELVLSLFDLSALVVLAWPFLRRRR